MANNIDEDTLTDKLTGWIRANSVLHSGLSDGPLFAEAMSELSYTALENLPSTLDQLQSNWKRLQGQLENLAAEHYSVFLEKADLSHSVLDNVSRIVKANTDLVDDISQFTNWSQEFSLKATSIRDSIKVNTNALDHHTKLLELLELPQLMETSINNGHYDDVIAVLNFAKKLMRKHGASNSVVKSVGLQIGAVGSQLIQQLCDQLRSPLSLPACIKTVVFLRRTGVFTESELRLKFLQTRTTSLEAQLAASLNQADTLNVDSGQKLGHGTSTKTALGGRSVQYEAYWKATRRIEVTRVHLFDIVTQYRAVFSDEKVNLPMPNARQADWSSLSGSKHELAAINPLYLPNDDCQFDVDPGLPRPDPNHRLGQNLLNAWLVHRITCFLQTLASDLQQMLQQSNVNVPETLDAWIALASATTLDQVAVTPVSNNSAVQSTATTSAGSDRVNVETVFTQLQSLLSQAVYFGRSFSRIGCDFRPHLVDLFYQSVMDFVKTYLDNATSEFAIALDHLMWRIVDPVHDDETSEPTLGEPHGEEKEKNSLDHHSNIHLSQSSPSCDELLHYPPLVLLFNRMMVLFNGLRLCCPLGLKHKLINLLVASLSTSSARIVTCYRLLVEQQQVAVNWRSDASALAAAYARTLVPGVIGHMLGPHLLGSPGSTKTPGAQSAVHVLIHRLGRLICSPLDDTWPHHVTATQAEPLGKNDEDDEIENGQMSPLPYPEVEDSTDLSDTDESQVATASLSVEPSHSEPECNPPEQSI